MKNIITLILCSLSLVIFAQKNIRAIEDFQKPNWSLLLSRLDTTQIRSGVLIDKTTSFANLMFYNTEKNNTSSSRYFIQSMSELHRGSNKTLFTYFDTS